jgi:pyridinium-3,5-biscarboxylic acid mononucleotide synthase
VNLERTRMLLGRVASGELDSAEALRQLAIPDAEPLSFATIDHHRALRQGFPEVVFAEGKTVEQVLTIATRLNADSEGFLITRVQPEMWAPLADCFPQAEMHKLGRVAYLPPATVLIITAGTSDLPVAEEAAICARAFGGRVERLTDVGVSGIHRLLSRGEQLQSAAVIIVVAGMEGALPSVVGGLVAVPVIAVPTSVGYGASLGGIAALLSMLNSCAAGVTVVNIDNGFGAAYAAARIIHR